MNIFCIHDWMKVGKPIFKMYDWDGFKVYRETYKCSKCGRIKNKKLIGKHATWLF